MPNPLDIDPNDANPDDGDETSVSSPVEMSAPVMSVAPVTARDYYTPSGNVKPDVVLGYDKTPQNFNPRNVTNADVRAVMGGLAAIESGGNRTGHINYNALGPDVGRGRGRALGGYQVMAENLPQWSADAGIDHAVSAEE